MSKEDKQLDEVLKVIHKKYGAGSLIDYGNVDKIEPVETISTGLATLDLILGGGVPKGRIMEVYGPYSSGKTTLALQMLAKCQQNEDKRVAFIDLENALDIKYAQKMGVDTEKLLLSQPDSGESALDIVEKLCNSNQVSCIVIDSVAQLVPMANLNKEIDGTANIATTARLLSQTIPRISNAAARSGTVLIFINQIRMNVGQLYGNPETTPGGMALKFASSVRIEVRGGKPESRNGKEGTVVRVNIKKNKIARPFRKAELFLIYGEGFDTVQNLLDTALFLEIVKQAGGWFSYGEFKEQGWLKLVGVLRKNADILKEIEEKISKIKV
jgi:recombination protein RecA